MSRLILIAVVIAIAWSNSTAAQTTDDAWRAEFDRGQIAYSEGRFIDAYDIWLPLAEGGICKAQFALGNLLSWELETEPGTTNDQYVQIQKLLETKQLPLTLEHIPFLAKAPISIKAKIYWFEQAALNRHPDASYKLGYAYYSIGSGLGIHYPRTYPSIMSAAIFWLTVSMEQENIDGMAWLAYITQTRNPALALESLLRLYQETGNARFMSESLDDIKARIPDDQVTYIEDTIARPNAWLLYDAADETCR